MLFNSFDFAVFLAIVLLLYRLLPHRGQNAMLLVASYVFYGWWDWRFLSLIALSTVVDFFCAQAISHARDADRKKRLLLISLTSNLGILGFFKYCDFFITSAAGLLEALGFQASLPTLNILLPVGISFYTFQTMGYTIDVYRGVTTPTKRFDTFALYVAYFPQLVAGPIERSRQLLPQIEEPRKVDASDWSVGLQLMVSRLLGIRLSVNFRQPYLSANISEIWRRWHISLSTWLRDYLYYPWVAIVCGRSAPTAIWRSPCCSVACGMALCSIACRSTER